MFYVNATRAPLDDIRVRQAISEAVDRSQLVIQDPVTGIEGLGTPERRHRHSPHALRKVGYAAERERRN